MITGDACLAYQDSHGVRWLGAWGAGCIQNDEFCINDDEFCNKNDEFCIL